MTKRSKQLALMAVIAAVAILVSFAVVIPSGVTVHREEEEAGNGVVVDFGVIIDAIPASVEPSEPPETVSPTESYVMLDINRATAQQMVQLLPGIGETLAGRIVEYRELNGDFDTVDELLEVDGIGEKLLERIRDSIYAG